MILGIHQGVKSGKISPVFCGDAQSTDGIDELLDGLIWLAPASNETGGELGVDIDGEPVELTVNQDGATAAIVFKTVADPFIGKLSYIKVVSGKLSTDSQLVNMRTGNQERIGKVLTMRAKSRKTPIILAPAILAQCRNCKALIPATPFVLPLGK